MMDWCPNCEEQKVELNKCKNCKSEFGSYFARPIKKGKPKPIPQSITPSISESDRARLRRKD